MNYQFKVGNDNGNAEHDIFINGEEFQDSNVFARAYNLKGYDEMVPTSVVKDIMNKLLVTIASPSCKAGTYLIGKSAIDSSFKLNEFKVGFDKKCSSDIPIISTLAKIAAYAVKKRFEEIGADIFTEKEGIDVAVEMATALPIDEFHEDDNNKNKFRDRFLNGPHTVNVHLGKIQKRVTIEFMKVAVTPEAAPVFWFLFEGLNDEEKSAAFLKEYMEEYQLEGVRGKSLANLRTLHVDVGSGTTEFPIVQTSLEPTFIRGENLGIGHAIEKALPEFRKSVGLPNVKRLQFDKIIKDKNHQFYDKAVLSIEGYLMEQADEIIEVINEEIVKADKEIDLILVYGGGSILLKDHLYDEIKQSAEATERAKVLYSPENFAVRLNALGLNAFVNSKTFEKIPVQTTVKQVAPNQSEAIKIKVGSAEEVEV